MPKIGAEVRTPDGKGVVMDTNAIKQLVKVKVEVGEDETDIREYAIDAIRILRKNARKDQNQNVQSTQPTEEQNG